MRCESSTDESIRELARGEDDENDESVRGLARGEDDEDREWFGESSSTDLLPHSRLDFLNSCLSSSSEAMDANDLEQPCWFFGGSIKIT